MPGITVSFQNDGSFTPIHEMARLFDGRVATVYGRFTPFVFCTDEGAVLRKTRAAGLLLVWILRLSWLYAG